MRARTHAPHLIEQRVATMSYWAYDRMGETLQKPSVDRMRELLASLDFQDEEHPGVSLNHESGWGLGAFGGGLLVWENVEQDNAQHMKSVPREKMLELWHKLAQGDIEVVDGEAWVAGYGWPSSASPMDSTFRVGASTHPTPRRATDAQASS